MAPVITAYNWYRWPWMNRLRYRLLELLNGAPLSLGLPPYTVAELHAAHIQSNGKDLPVTINWHAVAIQLAQKWLRGNQPVELREVAFADDAPSTHTLLDMLDTNTLKGFHKPYCVILWQGRGDRGGIQIIGSGRALTPEEME